MIDSSQAKPPVIGARGSIATAAAAVTVLYLIGRVIYNLYLHPLSRYPGPLLHRATRVAMVYKVLRGTSPVDVLNLHHHYGPVVRIAYNELSFLDPVAWRDIYNHGLGKGSQAEMPKYHKFYRDPGALPSLLSENKENHSMLRRQLAPGFSERAMHKQEPIINGYVDLLISRLREQCTPGSKHQVDIKDWYNWTTFDIIGDLAFGESFGCLDTAGYHPWVRLVFATVKIRAIMQAIKYMGLESIALPIVKLMKLRARKEHASRVIDKLKRRMDLGDRCDLIEGLLEKGDWNLDMDRLRANASLLIVAGSETTATSLSGVTYLLLKNPVALQRLVDEIRTTFKSEAEITIVSVQKLPYLRACLDEGLRLYPPIPIGMPRVVPSGGAWIAGAFIPQDMVVACWHYAMTHSNSHWSHPFSFDPDRFLDQGNPDDHLEAFQPFSVGPRNCIGINLAYAEMRLILARILFNFDLCLADPNVEWLRQKAYIIWNKPGLNVYLTPAQ